MARIKKTNPSKALDAEEIARRYAALRRQAEDLDAQIKEAKETLATCLAELPGQSLIVEGLGKYSLISPSRTTIDWEAILDKITPKQRALITVPVVDQKKFEAAVELGAIDSSVLDGHITETPTTPYVKETKK